MAADPVVILLEDILRRLARIEGDMAEVRARIGPPADAHKKELARERTRRWRQNKQSSQNVTKRHGDVTSGSSHVEPTSVTVTSQNVTEEPSRARDKDLPLSDSSVLVLNASSLSEEEREKEKEPTVPKRKSPAEKVTDPYLGNPLPEPLADQGGFEEAWEGYAAMRRRERHALTDRAAYLALRELQTQPCRAVRYLEVATMNAWKGVNYAWLDRFEGVSGNGNGHSPPAPPGPKSVLPEHLREISRKAEEDDRVAAEYAARRQAEQQARNTAVN